MEDASMAGQQGAESMLPSFCVLREDGFYVNPEKLKDDDFRVLVERIFGSDTYFFGLDYEAFTRLLYDFDPLDHMREARLKGGHSPHLVRVATHVAPFPSRRRALYKSVKIVDGQAEYYFEPVYLESEKEGADGESEWLRATLSFDEFVADMWSKGVRFGIDAEAVRAAIDTGRNERVVVAHQLDIVPGKDADVEELTEAIHRDNSPHRLSNGRLDLRQFKNRFPQIKAGVRLLKKIPRVMGVWGRGISGEPIEPPVPEDLDFAALAGPGTVVERNAEGEFIVSKEDGFLNIDSQSNQISIMEKIVNREGVSVRTTGNLQLSGNEYEEYGEIQENRMVEGYNITIHADVFGNISSLGGNIFLKSNLVGGSAVNQAGDIAVDGVASGAMLHAMDGDIYVKRAENCVIIGTRVEIETASNCDILADEVIIAKAEGCAIVAKSIKVESAAPRKQSEMLVFVRTPDLEAFDRKVAKLNLEAEEIERACKLKSAEIEQAGAQQEVRNYLMIAGKLKRNEITLNAEQKANLNKMGAAIAPSLKAIAKAHAEIGELRARQSAIAGEIAQVEADKQKAMSEIRCTVNEVAGEMMVREAKYDPDADPYASYSPRDLRARLRSSQAEGEKMFSGDDGALDWCPIKNDQKL